MHDSNFSAKKRTELKTPVRNNYYYGKLMDVYHFELETNYLNSKRWLLNRLISGYGVVCGLDVRLCPDGKSVKILPGIAIDKWGREIIVPKESICIKLPDPLPAITDPKQEESPPCDDNFVYIALCYRECQSDPAPILAGDCNTVEACASGSIKEQYKIEIKDGKIPDVDIDCGIPDLISRGRINYDSLVNYVTNSCRDLNEDPCIPLANIQLPEPGENYDQDNININIRPISYTNDLLFEFILELTSGDKNYPRGGKT